MKELTVFKNADGWNVRFEAGDEREGVIAVMGTDTIPLPFTVEASAETVVVHVQRHYPGADITLDVTGMHHGLSWTEVSGEVA